MKIKKNYIIVFLKDYGPPTLISIAWGLYVVYQKPKAPFFEVFAKNFIPAFFGLNWLAMRVKMTKKSVDNKERFEKIIIGVEKLQQKLDELEKKIDSNKNE